MSKWKTGLRYAIGIGISLLFILPLYWGVVASLRPIGSPPALSIEWLPTEFAWENYKLIFDTVPIARYTRNSLFVVFFAVPITALIASLAGFGLSQISDGGLRNLMMQFNIVALMIPGAAVWIFRFIIIKWLGLLDTLWALILPSFAATTPLFVMLFYWGFHQIPGEIFEAARLDGAGPIKLWWKLAMPLARPTLTGVLVLTFVLYWSDFITPVIYIFDPQKYTLAIGLEIIKQMDFTNIPLLMAAATFMAAPVIILFMFLQRFFLHDLSLANLFDKS
jgi:multiple sugar transport system permease protein